MIAAAKPRILLGRLLATPGALDTLAESGQRPSAFIWRHEHGDWGDVCEEDRQLNDEAADSDGRLLSEYRTSKGDRLWVITEADRSATTILRPDEY